MTAPRKLVFVLGDITLTLSADDIKAVLRDYERDNPGSSADQMSSDEFARRCMQRLKANARPTRTVLHN